MVEVLRVKDPSFVEINHASVSSLPCLFYASCALLQGDFVTTDGSEYALKEAIFTKGPMTVSVDAAPDSFVFYSSGVYNNSACKSDYAGRLSCASLIGCDRCALLLCMLTLCLCALSVLLRLCWEALLLQVVTA